MRKEIIEYLKNTENPYTLKFEDIIIEFRYSSNSRSFNECMKNVFKYKTINSNII